MADQVEVADETKKMVLIQDPSTEQIIKQND
jgi:hypothetical protein